jgi:hypothetical protein
MGQRQRLHLEPRTTNPAQRTPHNENPPRRAAGGFRLDDYRCRSNRSLSITLTHAAAKSLTNFSFASSSA